TIANGMDASHERREYARDDTAHSRWRDVSLECRRLYSGARCENGRFHLGLPAPVKRGWAARQEPEHCDLREYDHRYKLRQYGVRGRRAKRHADLGNTDSRSEITRQPEFWAHHR